MSKAATDSPPPWEWPPLEAYMEEVSQVLPAAAAAADLQRNVSCAAPKHGVTGSNASTDCESGRRDVQGITFTAIADVVARQREVEWLLFKIVERGVLAVVSGKRGTFKSFIVLDWAMRAATDHAGIVILSGEGAGLDRRVDAWIRKHAPETELSTINMVALESPRNLNNVLQLEAVSDAIAALPWTVDMVVIDTMSKFSQGLEENNNADVAAFLSGLSERIRDRFNCTVLLVVHAGHGEQSRPRGASALMANPDAEYIVERPDLLKMNVTVSRERFKDSPALPALAYTAEILHLGRMDAYGEPVTSLALITGDAPPKRPMSKGKNQAKAMTALREFMRNRPDSEHITSLDMKALLRAHGLMARQRQAEVTHFLVTSRILTPSIGGHTVDRAML